MAAPRITAIDGGWTRCCSFSCRQLRHVEGGGVLRDNAAVCSANLVQASQPASSQASARVDVELFPAGPCFPSGSHRDGQGAPTPTYRHHGIARLSLERGKVTRVAFLASARSPCLSSQQHHFTDMELSAVVARRHAALRWCAPSCVVHLHLRHRTCTFAALCQVSDPCQLTTAAEDRSRPRGKGGARLQNSAVELASAGRWTDQRPAHGSTSHRSATCREIAICRSPSRRTSGRLDELSSPRHRHMALHRSHVGWRRQSKGAIVSIFCDCSYRGNKEASALRNATRSL